MRIAYVAHVNGATSSGVAKKIVTQVKYWERSGHSVLLCVITRDDARAWGDLSRQAAIAPYTSWPSRLMAITQVVRAAVAFEPDLVYLRWDLFYPPMLALPRAAPLVIEANTDDVREYRSGSAVRAAYNRYTRRKLMRRARGMTFVTSELARSPSFRAVPAVRRVITNGIELDAYPELPAVPDEQPRLVFVGTAGQPWHGVDKLLDLARQRQDLRFHIVGSDRPRADQTPNVTWHGAVDNKTVLTILAQADVGVGTLALHRNGMNEACPLKLREYLAVGLPVIYAHDDMDIDGHVRESLRIENTEENVRRNIETIAEFAWHCRGRRVQRAAIGHIDASSKESERLRFFGELLEE